MYTDPSNPLYVNPSANPGLEGSLNIKLSDLQGSGLTIGARYCVKGTFAIPSDERTPSTVRAYTIFNQ